MRRHEFSLLYIVKFLSFCYEVLYFPFEHNCKSIISVVFMHINSLVHK